MKILVAGLSKSGTTLLYSKLKTAVPSSTRFLFEPRVFLPESDANYVLAKVIISERVQLSTFDVFDRKVLIVRDPRDRYVSAFLYSMRVSFDDRNSGLQEMLSALRQKEANPSNVSMCALIEKRRRLGDSHFTVSKELLEEQLSFFMQWQTSLDDCFILRYEDLIEGHLEELEKYLGLSLSNKTISQSKELDRVARTKSYGSWKNWFLASDLPYFRPIFDEFMMRYGYTDWFLADKRCILPENSSEYVKCLVADRRAKLRKALIKRLTHRILSPIKRALRHSFGS